MKILFITSNRLGDAVLSTGLLSWLVAEYPLALITIACGPYASGLFRAVPNVERLHILKKQTWNRHWIGLWQACVGTEWDLIVDLRNSIVSRLLRAKRRAYGGKHSGQHKVIEHAAVLGIPNPPAPHVWLDKAATDEAAHILPADRPILALGPAANWACKQWPIENFSELATQLTAANGALAGATVLVIADDKEREQILPLLQSIPDANRIELLGCELAVVAACLKRASLFVGNDSGLMHLSAAVGTKTLGLFGPGYEDIYGPWGGHCAHIRTVENRDELLSRLAKSDDKQLNLMRGLSVARVIEAIAQLLR
jgi:ADP-heptose:LPS heptosyltransferase